MDDGTGPICHQFCDNLSRAFPPAAGNQIREPGSGPQPADHPFLNAQNLPQAVYIAIVTRACALGLGRPNSTTADKSARLDQRHRTAHTRGIASPFAAFPLTLVIPRSFSGRTLFIRAKDN